MSRLTGGWLFEEQQPAAQGQAPRTKLTYTFSMWPKGEAQEFRRQALTQQLTHHLTQPGR
jgi:hypothetical protein